MQFWFCFNALALEKKLNSMLHLLYTMQYKHLKIFTVFLAVVWLLAVYLNLRQNKPTNTAEIGTKKLAPTEEIKIGGETLHVQLAKTVEEQMQGLSKINSIQEDEGMLFAFDAPAKPSFWMKGMRFPIDILWIRKGKIVGVEQNIPTPQPKQAISELPLYYPKENIDGVLEVRANWAFKHNVKIGTTITEKTKQLPK